MVGKCSSKSTVIKEMQEILDDLSAFDYRVDTIKRMLRSSTLLSDVDRDKLENELEVINENKKTLEASLKNLRRENSKTFAFAVILMFFSFLGYGLYRMSINQS